MAGLHKGIIEVVVKTLIAAEEHIPFQVNSHISYISCISYISHIPYDSYIYIYTSQSFHFHFHFPFQVNSFEVFGFDVLVDSQLRSWLIEVNSSPAMARETNLDEVVKERLMRVSM
jgi:tubulin polyglutamylase TTLL5